jgi:hypothetical protein
MVILHSLLSDRTLAFRTSRSSQRGSNGDKLLFVHQFAPDRRQDSDGRFGSPELLELTRDVRGVYAQF